MRTIVWFRGKDLRLKDHRPLHDALQRGEVIPLFVLDPYFFAPQRARELPHRMQFLLQSLGELRDAVRRLGSHLQFVEGRSTDVIPHVVQQWQADRVVAQGWSEPFARKRDRIIADALGSKFALFEGELLLPPTSLRTGAGTPYRVFTPFARAHRATFDAGDVLPTPESLPALPLDVTPTTTDLPTLESLGIDANPAIQPGGESHAQQRLVDFIRDRLAGYADGRDRMDREATSRLSADLKFGTLSVREVWQRVQNAGAADPDIAKFLTEILWREFTHHTLWDFPSVMRTPYREEFDGFPWREHDDHWQAWVNGRTGYPIVDASARELLTTGYVHNRARMISASFLTKHLLIDYRRGEAHYMKHLTDGDWANNNAGWQWSAGSGADAQPYFRVFNPMTQGKKFDPTGEYVRRWIPEIANLPTRFIHAPWEAADEVLSDAGVKLGDDYPLPIVDHKAARERFLTKAKEHLSR